MQQLITNLEQIAILAEEKQEENDTFRAFLKHQESIAIDNLVNQLNNAIAPQIDCTQCGRCCHVLMINVTEKEAIALAGHLQQPLAKVKEKYIEESQMGQMVMNAIPCHFLAGKKCTIYEHRFSGCREFPHLDRPGFTERLFGTFMHYAMCPIIFNVMEELKVRSGFKS